MHLLGLNNTVSIPELSSGTWLGHGKLRNKVVLFNPRRCLYITPLNIKPRSPTVSNVYRYIYIEYKVII